jgi:general secretion pathway protein D
MRMHHWVRSGLANVAIAAMLTAQAPPAPEAQAAPAPAQQPAPATQGTLTEAGGFLLQNVSLVDMIDILARRMKINYILDPRVKGDVTVNTHGEVRPADLMQLMQTILRINGATMVQIGDLYRIVPLAAVKQLPISPTIGGQDMATDERMVLNMVFLKYATSEEMAKVLQPFLGEGAEMTSYPAANLLLILDNTRNMRRTMDLIAMFDSDTFAGQRVRLFETTHGKPSDIAKELEEVFKAYALSEKSSGVRFLPIDRIGTIIAVAPNPGIFVEVEKWMEKLDVAVKAPAGSVGNYVYRLKYGRAETVAMAIMALYTGNIYAMMGLSAMANMPPGAGGMGMGMGGMGMGMGGGMYGGMGMGGMGMGGMYGGGMYGGGMYGGGMYGGGMMGAGGMGMGYPGQQPMAAPGVAAAPGTPQAAGAADLTGSYLGFGGGAAAQSGRRIPHVIPNPFDNTLLVQGTPQEWEQISSLLEQLDVPPRQVLVEARIYEIDLTGAFASGVAAYLRDRNAAGGTSGLSRTLLGEATGAGVTLTAGLLVGRSRQLLGILSANEVTGRARIISEPSVIATDSIAASINVGQEVPTLASQAVTGVQQGGNSLFASTVTNRNSGVTLSILARVNSSGIVTMVIDQEVSKPEPPTPGGIQSPSFSKRNVQTQVTVQDGDTVAIGGIIQESDTLSSSGVPVLHRIPILGGAFGNKSITKGRTELIIFLTPRVIYDTNQIVEATEELTGRLKRLKRMIKH